MSIVDLLKKELGKELERQVRSIDSVGRRGSERIKNKRCGSRINPIGGADTHPGSIPLPPTNQQAEKVIGEALNKVGIPAVRLIETCPLTSIDRPRPAGRFRSLARSLIAMHSHPINPNHTAGAGGAEQRGAPRRRALPVRLQVCASFGASDRFCPARGSPNH